MGGPDPVEVVLLGIGVAFLGAFWAGVAIGVVAVLRLIGAAVAGVVVVTAVTALTRRAVLTAIVGAYVAGMAVGALLVLASVAAEPTPPCRLPFPSATWLAGGLNGSDVAD